MSRTIDESTRIVVEALLQVHGPRKARQTLVDRNDGVGVRYIDQCEQDHMVRRLSGEGASRADIVRRLMDRGLSERSAYRAANRVLCQTAPQIAGMTEDS